VRGKRGAPTRDVFRAIADPTRRQLLDLLAKVDEMPLYELTAKFPTGRTAVSKHLAILKEAGLVEGRRVARESRYRLNAAGLRAVQDWVSFYAPFWTERIDRLKELLEEETPMHETVVLDFDVNSPIGRVWHALTDAATLSQWMMFEIGDFQPVVGHQFQLKSPPVPGWEGILDCEVLEVDEPHRLAYTWVGGPQGLVVHTTVTWTLTESDRVTHLHLEHSGFPSSAKPAIGGARYGWTRMADKLQAVIEAEGRQSGEG
jgi:uncharacterized protein YndB with AHSA1/START domain/DNA-binding transcriptional ArsR family regulator